jgi:hypothetical protein
MGDLVVLQGKKKPIKKHDDIVTRAIAQAVIQRNIERGDYDDEIINAMLEDKGV